MSLTVEHAADLPGNPGPSATFTGSVYVQMVMALEDGSASVYRVSFERGARTHWHAHTGEQVIYFLEGRGRVQLRGEPVVDAVAGDVVRIPPGTPHWHGAHPEEPTRMRHLTVNFGEGTWLGPVSEEDYRAGA